MIAKIVSIGDEILLGHITDTNATFIAKQLSEIGIKVNEIRSIGDQVDDLVALFNSWTSQAELIITTGGLGPTKDDLTKKALAEFLQVELMLDNASLELVKKRLDHLGLQMNELNHDQALIPNGSTALPNQLGTAPGIWTKYGNCIIINLAGVPQEMKALMQEEVIPRLKNQFTFPSTVHRFLKISNYPESELAIALKDWENNLPTHLHLAYLAENGAVQLRLTTHGENREKLESELQTQFNKIIPLLANHLEEPKTIEIEEALGQLLLDKKMSLSTAESCTGGFIAHLLTSVSGSSAYFKGGIVAYATTIKEDLLNVPRKEIEQFSVVSEAVATAMAEGVRKQLNTDFGISTTGVAGPQKGEDGKEVGTVCMAISDGDKTFAQSYFLPELDRKNFIEQVSKLALQMAVQFISKK